MIKQAYAYAEALEAVAGEVDSTLRNTPELIRTYTQHLTQSKGKMIRTQALLACALDEELYVPGDAVRFAAAIEILHLATLVHDDVMDDADIRRGIFTIQHQFGKRTAVICGDYLLSLSLKQMNSLVQREEYRDLAIPNYVERVCMGELRQHLNHHNFDLLPYRYFSIIGGKTAALFEASFHAGIITRQREEGLVLKYRKLGHYLGMIFQMIDDCIDFEEQKSTAMKPVQSDYEQGVITLPLIIAFSKSPSLKKQAEEGNVCREELNHAVKECMGLQAAREYAEAYYRKALRLMDRMGMQLGQRDMIENLFEKACRGLQK